MKVKLTCILFLIIIASPIFGQRGKDNTVLTLPAEFQRVEINDERGQFNVEVMVENLEENSGRSSASSGSAGRSWKVFSDRSRNKLYTDQTLQTDNGQVAKIGEMFYVISEDKGSLEVVQLKYSVGSMGDYASDDVLKQGWISKKNVLLWSKPLISLSSQFELKAFLVNSHRDNISKVKSGEIDKDLVKLYDSPSSTEASDKQQLYEVLFVYNFDPQTNRFLLGTEPTLEALKYELFWVSTFRLKTWNTRVALEWNFNPEACAERQANDLKSGIFFATRDKAESLRDGTYSLDQYRKSDFVSAMDPCSSRKIPGSIANNHRYTGDVMRYPFFGNHGVESDIIQCGSVVKFGYQTEYNDYSELNEWPEVKNNLEQVVRSGKYANCMLVIQGSPEMYKEHASSLSGVVDQCLKLGEREEFRGKVKIGAVIYKSKHDNQPVFEFSPTSDPTQIQRLKEELSNKKYYLSGGNVDCRGLMKYGIKQALNGFQEKETNIALLMGACGDAHMKAPDGMDKTYVANEELEQLLYKYDVNVLAVQRYTDPFNRAASSRFNSELDGLLSNVLNSLDADYQAFAENKMNDPDFKFTQYLWEYEDNISKGYEYQKLTGSHLSMGVLYAPNPADASLDETTYNLEVSTFLQQVADKRLGLINFIENLVVDDSPLANRTSEAGAELDKMLLSSGLSADAIEMAKQQKVQLLTEGYTPFKIKGSDHNVYKYVLFMEKGVLLKLIEKMEDFIRRGGNNSDQRNALVDAWYEYAGAILNQDPKILKDQYAGDQSRVLYNILHYGIREIDRSSGQSIFAEFTADQIAIEEGEVSKQQIHDYLLRISDNREQLERLLQNDEMIYRTKHHAFYWVDIALLP